MKIKYLLLTIAMCVFLFGGYPVILHHKNKMNNAHETFISDAIDTNIDLRGHWHVKVLIMQEFSRRGPAGSFFGAFLGDKQYDLTIKEKTRQECSLEYVNEYGKYNYRSFFLFNLPFISQNGPYMILLDNLPCIPTKEEFRTEVIARYSFWQYDINYGNRNKLTYEQFTAKYPSNTQDALPVGRNTKCEILSYNSSRFAFKCTVPIGRNINEDDLNYLFIAQKL